MPRSARSRSAGSLCLKMRFSQPLWRMPSIIEAWLSASEKITQPGSSLPMVLSAASLAL